MEKLYFKKMMEDYNSIKSFSEESYQEVSKKVILRKIPKNEILKRKNEVDDRSRYLCEGLVGLYDGSQGRDKLTLLFGPTDTVFDEEGFRENRPTPNSIKALSDSVLFEFTIEAERALLAHNSDFRLLALEVAHRIGRRTFEQLEIKTKGFKKGFPDLKRRFPDAEILLKNQELADYFSTSIRTIERQKSQFFNPRNHG